MSRVLVTGASGFVGGHLLPLLVARGHEVHAMSRFTRSSSSATWHDTDLMDARSVSELFADVRPEVLVHLAWYTNPGDFWWSQKNVEWVEATLRLARAFASLGGRRFVGVGTCAEYDPRFGFCSEGLTPLQPSTLYGASKHATHSIIESAADRWGIEVVWPRIFFPYGPGEPSSKLVSYVIGCLLRGRTADCTTGQQIRDYIHVSDVAAFLARLVDGRVVGAFNVGSGVPVTVGEVALTIGRLLGLPHLVRLGARQSDYDDPPLLLADMRKSQQELSWSPSLSLEQGLSGTIEFLKAEARATL